MDVYFPDPLPKVYDALLVKVKNIHGETVIIEVLQILEDNVVRGISMTSMDGLRRGDVVKNTGKPIAVPVGKEVLGHIFNALGQSLDVEGSSVHLDKTVT